MKFSVVILLTVAVLCTLSPVKALGFTSVLSGLANAYKVVKWLQERTDTQTKPLTLKTDSSWDTEHITWYTVKNTAVKYHFIYPNKDRTGAGSLPALGAVKTEIFKADNTDMNVKKVLENLNDAAGGYGWHMKVTTGNGPPRQIKSSQGRGCIKVDCPPEFFIIIGPWEQWTHDVAPDFTLTKRHEMYQRQCDQLVKETNKKNPTYCEGA